MPRKFPTTQGLGNKEILVKSENCMGTHPSAQSPLHQ